MSFILRQVAHCDVCGHEWLTAKVPSHCAKCKSRKWNQAPEMSPTRVKQYERELKALPPAKLQAFMDGGWKFTGKHNPKTCRIYKCGMCAASKG